MKKALSLVLALVLCLPLCACDQEVTESYGAYEDLIAAIESNNYDRALRELQDLMGIEPEQPPTQQTVPSACTHSGPAADCISDSYCNHCGELLTKALGHDYVDGECTRCKSTDPEMAQMIKDYNALISQISDYENNGAFFAGNNRLYGSDAVGYLYGELTKMGDFRDCAQYLERITVLPDQLLYIKLLETDNLGNIINSTNIDYGYDRYGRVTMSEDAEFLNQLGILRNTYASGVSQNYVTITYGDDGRIVEYRLYYVQLVEIITPTYDESGRIQSAYHKENVGGYTTYFDYDDHGRLIRVWDDVKDYAILYTYNSDGTLVSKTCEGDYWDAWFKDSMKEYQYDEHGNLVGWTSGSIVPTVEFDDQGRIVREHIVKSNGVLNYEYVYGSWYVYTKPTPST